MAWDSVIGQHNVVRMLQHAITTNRLPHALLLTGSDGSGVLAIAIALARTLTCSSPNVQGASVHACGVCRSCKQNISLHNPNVVLVTALPSGNFDDESELPSEVIDELRERISRLAANPYMSLELTGATSIRIGQIRWLKRALSLSAVQEGRRVVILHNIDSMTVEASNAFLKTLEEPHENTVLILTTPSTSGVLPTITSRCQVVRIPALDDHDIVARLVADGIPPAEATVAAAFAEGDMTAAYEFLQEDVHAERATAIHLLRSVLKGRDFRLSFVEAVVNSTERNNKQRALLILRLLAVWLRDVQNIITFGPDTPISNMDQREALIRFATSFAKADLSEALSIVERAASDIRRNVSVHLVFITALLALRHLLYATVSTTTVTQS